MQWSEAPHLSKQGLFVVGHARSGTSILMRALNMSRDVFMLAEPSLYRRDADPGFPAWYNKMHTSFGNPRSKTSYCPIAPSADANAVATLDWLSQRFRYVGTKEAFRSSRLGYDLKGFFDFQGSHFFDGHYVCIVREPVAMLESNMRMFKPEDADLYAESTLDVLCLIGEMYATFPNVLVVQHEHINEETFSTIGKYLGIDLGQSFAFYREERQKFDPASRTQEIPFLETLTTAHELLISRFSPQTLKLTPGPDFDEILHALLGYRRTINAAVEKRVAQARAS